MVVRFLGGISLAMRSTAGSRSPWPSNWKRRTYLTALHAIITTLHRTTAAVLLGLATLLAVWCWRLAAMGPAEEINAEIEAVTHEA